MKKWIILVLCFLIARPAILEALVFRSRPKQSYVIRGQAPTVPQEDIAWYELDVNGEEFIWLPTPSLTPDPAPKPLDVPQDKAPIIPHVEDAWYQLDDEEKQFIAELDALRTSLGLPQVFVAEHIVQDCRNWSAYLQRTGRFHHGSNQENIAMGHEDGTATFRQWRRSPGHNAKLCNRNDMVVGIGRVENVWTYRAAPCLDTYQSGKTPPAPTPPTPAE